MLVEFREEGPQQIKRGIVFGRLVPFCRPTHDRELVQDFTAGESNAGMVRRGATAVLAVAPCPINAQMLRHWIFLPESDHAASLFPPFFKAERNGFQIADLLKACSPITHIGRMDSHRTSPAA